MALVSGTLILVLGLVFLEPLLNLLGGLRILEDLCPGLLKRHTPGYDLEQPAPRRG